MQIDALSLMVPNGFTAAAAGLFVLITWLRWSRPASLGWWGGANLIYGIAIGSAAIGIMAGSAPLFMLGVALITLAPGMIWAGARRFESRPAPLWVVFSGLAVWLAGGGTALLVGADHAVTGAMIAVLLWPGFLGAAVFELWRGRSEKLPPLYWFIAVLVVHGAAFLTGAVHLMTGALGFMQAPSLVSVSGILHFESLLFSMGGAVSMIMLVREREAAQFKQTAQIDEVTGTLTCRAFFEAAERQAERCRHDGSPMSLIILDLDRFKHVNDTLGHTAGDRVLRGFCDTANRVLRPNDVIGRFGGEEIIVVLPNTSIAGGTAVAERIRVAFAKAFEFIEGQPLNATVSAGVAELGDGNSLEDALKRADTALYRAKQNGRNRVERDQDAGCGDDDRLVRIA